MRPYIIIAQEIAFVANSTEKNIYLFILFLNCWNDLAPSYLSDMIKKYTPNRPLRSSDKTGLLIPKLSYVANCNWLFTLNLSKFSNQKHSCTV